MSDSLQFHGLYLIRLLCPWDFPGMNTGVDCHFLLQGIFLRNIRSIPSDTSPRIELASPDWQADSLLLIHWGSPHTDKVYTYIKRQEGAFLNRNFSINENLLIWHSRKTF